MNITDPLVLRGDVILVPVTDLAPEVREKITYDDGDYTLTSRHGRVASQVIDGETAALLELFRSPRTIAEAVVANSRALKKNPEAWLDELLPHLGTFLENRVLVPAGAEEEKEIEPRFAGGTVGAGYRIVRCVSLIEDTEIYTLSLHDALPISAGL